MFLLQLTNIMYSPPGILKIIDFGLATRFKSGQLLYDDAGTSGYMAPEISDGARCGYDGPPADVWSLGILFMKLFVGDHFRGDDILVVSIVCNRVMIILTNSCHHDCAQSSPFEHNQCNCYFENHSL